METFDQATDAGTMFLCLDAFDRIQIATTIERLINRLDELDGDENLEPYLAGVDGGPRDDREGDLDVQEGDNGDDWEPSLGSLDAQASQAGWGWSGGTADDLELDISEIGLPDRDPNHEVIFFGGAVPC